MTDVDPEATVISIDGVWGVRSDLQERDARRSPEDGERGSDLPFWIGRPSTYLWEDEMGATQIIQQGEGGEQGDPLMPMLFALGQHPALPAAQARLQDNEPGVCLFG